MRGQAQMEHVLLQRAVMLVCCLAVRSGLASPWTERCVGRAGDRAVAWVNWVAVVRRGSQAKLEEERRNSALAREQQNEHARSVVEQAAAARRQEAAAVATRLNARLQEAAARR